jgi:hypothetical protein
VQTTFWFDDLSVLGGLPPAQALAKLSEIGAGGAPAKSGSRGPRARSKSLWPFQDKPWQHTAHAFGHLAPAPPGSGLLPIRHAGNIAPDVSLRSGRIKITLSGLRVADYPGRGTHRILFDFYAENQVPGGTEPIHFNTTYRVREGEQTAVLGYPLFLGLKVGREGVSFKCFTVNVQNEEDETFLDFLESDVFRAGLKLATTAQPALAPFATMSYNLTRGIAARSRNVPVQDFFLGLDFNANPMGARLAEGSYIAVQIPESLRVVWSWDDWVYDPSHGRVVNREDAGQLIPYNYVVFNVSRYAGE